MFKVLNINAKYMVSSQKAVTILLIIILSTPLLITVHVIIIKIIIYSYIKYTYIITYNYINNIHDLYKL